MNLHEYQGKSLFAEYNLPVSKGEVIFDAKNAIDACNKIGGTKWVVKAQVHAGGRGKAGGVELINSPVIPKNLGQLVKLIITNEISGKIAKDVLDDMFASGRTAREIIDDQVGLQGNMDPRIFYSDYSEIEQYLNGLIDFGSKNQNWIFNLGHGFIPDIDHKKVKFVVDWIKQANWKR